MTRTLAPHLLTNAPLGRQARPGVRFLGALDLAPARVHEFCGPARRTLAVALARAMEGPVLWIAPSWQAEALYPPALARWIDPGRVIFVGPRRGEDLLWSMEESLRSGAVPLVVADLPDPPPLTPVRRLHLAAEAGAVAATPPIGLLLTPGAGGAAGVESRWSLAPRHGTAGETAWRLDRLRARTLPPAAWRVTPAARGGLALGAPLPSGGD